MRASRYFTRVRSRRASSAAQPGVHQASRRCWLRTSTREDSSSRPLPGPPWLARCVEREEIRSLPENGIASIFVVKTGLDTWHVFALGAPVDAIEINLGDDTELSTDRISIGDGVVALLIPTDARIGRSPGCAVGIGLGDFRAKQIAPARYVAAAATSRAVPPQPTLGTNPGMTRSGSKPRTEKVQLAESFSAVSRVIFIPTPTNAPAQDPTSNSCPERPPIPRRQWG